MRTRLLVISFLLVGALCACEDQVESFQAVHGRGIVNGEVAEPGQFPSTVALGGEFGSSGPSAMCTGNLVTPRVIISAAHCGDGIPIELVQALGVAYFGTDVTAADTEIGFDDLVIHPDYVPLDNAAGELGEFDLSVFVLKEDAPVEPTWFRREAVTGEDLDAQLTSVGFGITSAGGSDSGIKRYANLILDDYDENFLLTFNSSNPTDSNICSGDSGGPQFFYQDGFYIEGAVHSWGDVDCAIESGSTRVDIATEWFLDQIEAVHGIRDVCEINGWYGDGLCHPFCDLPDPDCAPDAGVDAGADADAGVDAGGDHGLTGGGCGCAISQRPTSGLLSALLVVLIGASLFFRRRSRS